MMSKNLFKFGIIDVIGGLVLLLVQTKSGITNAIGFILLGKGLLSLYYNYTGKESRST